MPQRASKPAASRAASHAAHANERAAPVKAASMIEAKIVAPLPSGIDHARSLSVAIENAHAASAAEASRRFAVIDIGSNSVRLMVVALPEGETDRFSGGQAWTVLCEERSMTRLAHGLSETRELASESMAGSVEAIARFVTIAEKFGVRPPRLRAFATAAVRDAKNRSDFLSLVRDRAGIGIEIISGLEEGKFTHQSVERAFDLTHGRCAVVDIGGGSMEVVFSHDGVITDSTSMPLGAVRLTEQFGGADEAAGKRWKDLREYCQRTIDRSVRVHGAGEDVPPHTLVGCGGTFNTLATLAAASRGIMITRGSQAQRDLGPVTREQLKGLISQLRAVPLAERLRVPGLPSDRADIIIAGLTAVERLMRHLGVGHVHTHPGGVREGLMLKVIAEASKPTVASRRGQRHVQDSDALRDLREAMVSEARELAKACRYEQSHSEQVAKLSLQLFDQLASDAVEIVDQGSFNRWGLDPFERAMLEAAGVLHDIGIMVQYRQHHKHSSTIVRHADLPHWSDRDREMLALICRYHRRSEPGERHEDFAALTPVDKALVRRLSAVLRVADGLDRSHARVVREVCVRKGKQQLTVEVHATNHAHEERRAARDKGGLLETLLGMDVEFELERDVPEIATIPGARMSKDVDHRHVTRAKAGK
jgi:exopolyphosphatase/guanosine-5'-triphosphate,3'-diphosphate pyrophosphatase